MVAGGGGGRKGKDDRKQNTLGPFWCVTGMAPDPAARRGAGLLSRSRQLRKDRSGENELKKV